MKAMFGGQQTELSHHSPLKRFGDPDVRNSHYVFSGADGGSVDVQFYGVRQIPLSFSCVEHDGKLAEIRRNVKIARTVRFVTEIASAAIRQRTCLSDYCKRHGLLLIKD